MPRTTAQKADPAQPAAAVTATGSIPVPEPVRRESRRRAKKKSITTRVRERAAQDARNVPPVIRTEINAASQHLGTPRPRDFGSTGEVAPSGMPERLVEPVEGPNAMSRADELAFNEEVLTVVVHTTSDQNADPFPTFWVNGEKAICFRGVERQVKRKFVERMARSRINNVRQRYYVDATGNHAISNEVQGSLMYPFAVLHDPNPKGAAWLKKILAEQ
jgi:hypothetical protein